MAENGNGDYGGKLRSPSPPREDRRSRSRSPVRMDTDRPPRDDDRRGGDRRDDRRGRGDGGVNPGNNLHVSGLSTRVEDRDLEEIFSKYGRIQKCQVMRDPHTKDSRGFAFVTMEIAEDAEAAIAGLNATELMGRTVNIEKARRGRARTPTPGAYHGPPKRDGGNRPYDPSRGGYGGDRRDGYGGGGHREYRPAPDYGRDRYGDAGGYARPMRDDGRGGGYDDRRGGYDDRRGGGGYDDRRRDDRRDDRRGGYDDRRRDERRPY